jgi:ribokinase
MNSGIAVVGSLNMDFVVDVDHLPAPGETVLGGNFQMIPGGKGANQACAAGRLASPSSNVRMLGRVGYDLFADHLRASLSAAGVDIGGVHATRSQPTGVALIWVDGAGQNSIVVAPGANLQLLAADVEAMRRVFREVGFALFQLETPLETVEAALRVARQEDAQTILDPAPARRLDPQLLALVDFLTPNETEARILLGRSAGRVEPADAPEAAAALLDTGVRAVILKLGDAGCCYADRDRVIRLPAFAVSARDTTAAGDTFNAGLAVALAEGKPIEEALRFASAAAAISVTRLGAQASAPSRSEVDAFLLEADRV